jgi:hypothetical protein
VSVRGDREVELRSLIETAASNMLSVIQDFVMEVRRGPWPPAGDRSSTGGVARVPPACAEVDSDTLRLLRSLAGGWTWLALALVAILAVAAPFSAAVLSDVSATVRCDVTNALGTTPYPYRYEYTVTNTSSTTAIAALRINGFWGTSLPATGWTGVLSPILDSQIWRAVEASAVISPGDTRMGFSILSRSLPGVGRVTLFPAVVMSMWDQPSPAGAEQAVIGPVIGSAQLEPVAAAAEIVRELRGNFIPAFAAVSDGTAPSLDRLLTEAGGALRQRDLNVAEAALRDARAVSWEASSAWRVDLHRNLDIDLAYLVDLLSRPGDLTEAETTSPLFRGMPPSVWVYPGMTPPASTDLKVFTSQTALGLVGTVDSVSLEAVDQTGTDHRTRVRLDPTELLWGERPGDSVDVWIRGGVLGRLQGLEMLSPRAPADVVVALHPGDVVFAAPQRFAKPGSTMNGQLWIAAPETFAFIRDGHVYPGPTYSAAWIEAVLKLGAALARTDPSADQATLFITTLRTAARQRSK